MLAPTNYSGTRFSLQLPGGWTATTGSDGLSLFSSANGDIHVTVAELPATRLLGQADLQALITQVAVQLGIQDGVQYSVTFQPLTIGTLTGVTGVSTRPDNARIVMLGVATDGAHIVLAQTTFYPSTVPEDIQGAAQLVASVRPTS